MKNLCLIRTCLGRIPRTRGRLIELASSPWLTPPEWMSITLLLTQARMSKKECWVNLSIYMMVTMTLTTLIPALWLRVGQIRTFQPQREDLKAKTLQRMKNGHLFLADCFRTDFRLFLKRLLLTQPLRSQVPSKSSTLREVSCSKTFSLR